MVKWKTEAVFELRLHRALWSNDLEYLRHSLELTVTPKYTSINISDFRSHTPLHYAAAQGRYPILEALLEYGADPNIFDSKGDTALHLAILNEHVPEAEQLLLCGADVNAHIPDHDTPLHTASRTGNLKPVDLLLRNGATGN